MIVICTRCQAKFRVADERIGPRGARVRCSKCQTVFAVHRDLGSIPSEAASPPAPAPAARPALVVDLEPPRSPPRPGPPAARPAPAQRGEPPRVPPPLAPAADDPFAAAVASDDPFAPAVRGDPFPSSAPDDPFASASSPPPPAAAGGDADPFASPASLLAQASDPFAASVTPRAASHGAGATALPVTDLSDLLGEATPASLRTPPRLPPTAFDSLGGDDGPGIALEERLTPPPVPPGAGTFGEPEPPPPPAGFEPGAFSAVSDPHAFDPAERDGGPTDEPSLALATDPSHAEPIPAPRPAYRAAAGPQPAVASPPPAQLPEPPPDRIPGGRAARARSLAVNAAALAVLLLVAFALLAAWRAGGKLELASLRPAAVLEALRGGPAATFAAERVSSGIYERELGPPVLYVRGVASSRAPAPVRALRVRVEVVRGERVIARGEALAGAVPTPEELHRAADGAALAAAMRAAEARRPREIRGGDAVPFLVVIADHPADLAGAALRVSVEATRSP